MTHDEHVARALLLGAVYKDYIHCYVFELEAWQLAGSKGERWLDADTLQEIPQHDKIERLRAGINDPE